MTILTRTVATLAIAALPFAAVAQGNGNGNGNGKGNGQAAQNNGNGNGNGNRGNGNGNGNRGNASAGQDDNGNRGNGNGNRGNGGDGNGNNGNANRNGGTVASGTTLRSARPENVFACPPGLAKKTPPCVPPGLARKGVTFNEWTGYSDDEIAVLINEADDFLTEVEIGDGTSLLYPQDEIVALYGLDPAPDGQNYAVIDGNVVRVADGSYGILRQLRGYATPVELRDGLAIAPTATLTEEELVTIYGLDDPTDDRRYTVIDGDLVALPTQAYDLLQLLRYTAAIL